MRDSETSAGLAGRGEHTSIIPGSHAGVVVAIVSRVRLVRDGLTASLQAREGIAELHAIDLDRNGLEELARIAPQVVLVDLHGAGPSASVQLLRSACPAARLVAFAVEEVDETVFACAAAGYASYVSSDSDAEGVLRVVLDAAQGRMTCSPRMTAALFGRLADLHRDEEQAIPQLTARESEILHLAGGGCSNKEIARQLAISAATVKNHMHNILQKLQVERRGQAAARLRPPR